MRAMASQATASRWLAQPIAQALIKEKTPKLRVTGLCVGKSPVTGNVSIWWRHYVGCLIAVIYHLSTEALLTDMD